MTAPTSKIKFHIVILYYIFAASILSYSVALPIFDSPSLARRYVWDNAFYPSMVFGNGGVSSWMPVTGGSRGIPTVNGTIPQKRWSVSPVDLPWLGTGSGPTYAWSDPGFGWWQDSANTPPPPLVNDGGKKPLPEPHS
ncbi:hypothetical protein EIP91_003547 [Steccherinum ochraceum]|uniref:Uncharacterized protein n=1 Tax=Steccherinum ochraceum TaxID=92696 RepID=A0A4R0RDQ5_9APHY|nr:hypothetical protein EIP91_003547 [Steccherinum ochraceum]